MGRDKGGDIEAGFGHGEQLYPMMNEPPQIRWAFIRKVYAILSMQLMLTTAVAATVIYVSPIEHFMLHTTPGLVVFIISLVLPLILLCPLAAYYKHHPVNLVLLALFTITMAIGLGVSCAHVKGRIVFEAAILTSVMVVSLTLYTFWAVKRGQDFSFLGPFLFASLMVLMVFGLIQIIFPLGKLSMMIYGCMGAIIFSAYIVYDTDNLIKRFSYDEYIWASVSLYMDIVNLFLFILQILEGADG